MKKLMLIAWLVVLPLPMADASENQVFQKANECFEKTCLEDMKARLARVKDGEKHYLSIVYHNLASVGQDKYLEQALEQTQIAFQKTKNLIFLGYHGSCLTLQAGVLFAEGNIGSAMQQLSQGVAEIDQAVKLSPTGVQIRLLRMSNAVAVSKDSPMDRYPQVRQDLEYLKTIYPGLPASVKSAFHLFTAKLKTKQAKNTEAISHLEKCIRLAPKSIWATAAKGALKAMEQ